MTTRACSGLAPSLVENQKIFVANHPIAPQIGKVSIQAVTISKVTPQRTAENLLVAPRIYLTAQKSRCQPVVSLNGKQMSTGWLKSEKAFERGTE